MSTPNDERLRELREMEMLATEIALARKAAVDRGVMGTTTLEMMITEFAPQLRPVVGE